MKKSLSFYITFILLLVFCLNTPVFSEEVQDVFVSEDSQTECKNGVCNVDINELSKKQHEKEIKNFFSAYQKAFNSHSTKKVLQFYDDNYINSDGLNNIQTAKLLDRTFENFPDIKTDIQIIDIVSDSKYAIVYLSENKQAETKTPSKITNDKGIYKSVEKKVIYLEEFNGKWTIYSDNILEESSITSYGIGKDINAELIVPQKVATNSDYAAYVCVFPPEGYSAMASINRGELSEDYIYKGSGFRSVKKDTGTLERMFKANNENNNEFVMASVGFSKMSSSMFKDASLDLKGFIMLMKRVNVVPNTRNIELQKASEGGK